jgi:DNA end-binding protein Ku
MFPEREGDEPRSVWKGFLRFSLVSIPVKAVSAKTPSARISLSWLHKDCFQPIKYKKVCPVHGEVRQDEIVSGYKINNRQYIPLGEDELKEIRAVRDDTVHVETFVEEDALDPVYLTGSSYYLLPNGANAGRPFVVFQRAMRDLGRTAIARAVLFRKEQIVLVRPVGEVLVMTGLSYDREVRQAETFDAAVPQIKPTAKETQLAASLIEASTEEDFDFATLKDRYAERFEKLVEEKKEGHEITPAPKGPEVVTLDFAEALKRSLRQARAEAKTPKRPAAAKRRRKGA